MEHLYVSAMAPTELTTFQGEVQESNIGWLNLYFSTVPKPMRASLVEGGRQVSGLLAKTLLDHFMDGRSRRWLDWLLYAYPGHVIEFSCYKQCWGTLPGHNTVFWEVRKY